MAITISQPTTDVEKEIEMEQIRKLIIRGVNIVFFPTEKKYWKKNKRIQRKIKFTRYMSGFGTNFYAKTKKRMWFDYEQNCFKPRSKWFKNKDPYFEYNM